MPSRFPQSDSWYRTQSSPLIICTVVCRTTDQDSAVYRLFDVAGPQTWNKLPASMTLLEIFGYFRKLLNAHLFD